MSNNYEHTRKDAIISVANSVAFSAFSTFLAQNPIKYPNLSNMQSICASPSGTSISNPRFSVNDYVKHVYTKGKHGIVINVDPSRFSYFGSKIPAYLVGWESHCDSNGVVIFGEECWVSAGSIRKLRFVETKPECNGGFTAKETLHD